MVERAEFYKKAAVIQVHIIWWNSSTNETSHSTYQKHLILCKCDLQQAEGDTEAAELLASAFAKVKDLLWGTSYALLTNAILWHSMLQTLVIVLADMICDLQAGEGLVELRRIEAAEAVSYTHLRAHETLR